MNRKLFFAICLLASSPAYAAMVGGVLDPMTKVRPHDTPALAREADLGAARNEWEPFQVVVCDPRGSDLFGVYAVFGQLTGPGGYTIDRIDLYREHYVNVPMDSHKPVRPTDIGLWPDALVPFVDRYFHEERTGAPFDVPAGESRVIWVDIYVPGDAPPGDYTGTLVLTDSTPTRIEIPVRLKVFDYTLPPSATLVSTYGFSAGQAYSTHQAYGGILTEPELARYYWAEALEHRITLSNPGTSALPWYFDQAADKVVFDWTAFDEELSDVLSGTFDLTLPGNQLTTYRLPNPNQDWHVNELYWRGFLDHFQKKGWADKLFLYLPDEPSPEEYPALISITENLHAADPSLRALVTNQLVAPLMNVVDIWCPDEPLFSDSLPWGPHAEDYPPRQDKGEDVWWYNCMSAQFVYNYSNHFVDSEGNSMRVWPWLTRRYNFTGLLYWHTLYLYSHQDVWEDAWAEAFKCNGDGTLFYPGVPSRIGGVHDIPIASIRLKLLREGMEDYEYFKILDDLGQSDFVQQEVEARAQRTWIWESDPQTLLQSRRRIAQKIEEVQLQQRQRRDRR